MTSPVLTVREQTPVAQAAALLARNRYTALPVVDDFGRLIGIVSEADLVGDPLTEHAAAPRTIGGVMTTDVISMPPDAEVGKLAHRMHVSGRRMMPITDAHRRLVGVVSRADLVEREPTEIAPPGWVRRTVHRLTGRGTGAYADPAQMAPSRQTVSTLRGKRAGPARHAADIMTPDPIRVQEGTAIGAAIECLQRYRFSALPVVDQEDRLVGIVSSDDLLPDPLRNTLTYPKPRPAMRPRTVGSVMTADVVFRIPQADLAELAHWMHTTGLRVMPIVDNDEQRHLVGIVTRSDLMGVRESLDRPR